MPAYPTSFLSMVANGILLFNLTSNIGNNAFVPLLIQLISNTFIGIEYVLLSIIVQFSLYVIVTIVLLSPDIVCNPNVYSVSSEVSLKRIDDNNNGLLKSASVPSNSTCFGEHNITYVDVGASVGVASLLPSIPTYKFASYFVLLPGLPIAHN